MAESSALDPSALLEDGCVAHILLYVHRRAYGQQREKFRWICAVHIPVSLQVSYTDSLIEETRVRISMSGIRYVALLFRVFRHR